MRVLGASDTSRQAVSIIASHETYDLIVERGEADMKSEIERFPRLFRTSNRFPGLPGRRWSSTTQLTLRLGKLAVEIVQVGRGHSKGDTIVWLPSQKVLFAGDLVEYGATPYSRRRLLHPLGQDARQPRGPRRREARARSRCGAGESGGGAGRHRRHPHLRHRPVRDRAAGSRRGQGPEGGVPGHLAVLEPMYGHGVIYDHCMPFDVTRAY